MNEVKIIQIATGGENGEWLYGLDSEGGIHWGFWSGQQFSWKKELPPPIATHE